MEVLFFFGSDWCRFTSEGIYFGFLEGRWSIESHPHAVWDWARLKLAVRHGEGCCFLLILAPSISPSWDSQWDLDCFLGPVLLGGSLSPSFVSSAPSDFQSLCSASGFLGCAFCSALRCFAECCLWISRYLREKDPRIFNEPHVLLFQVSGPSGPSCLGILYSKFVFHSRRSPHEASSSRSQLLIHHLAWFLASWPHATHESAMLWGEE